MPKAFGITENSHSPEYWHSEFRVPMYVEKFEAHAWLTSSARAKVTDVVVKGRYMPGAI